MGRRTPLGKFIHSSWANMNIRAGKYRHLNTKEKCKHYENVKISFTQPEYKLFCENNSETILSLLRPSVDRIDPNGGYDLANIQFIELGLNISKDKTMFTDTQGTCSKCKEVKSLSEFPRDNRKLNGLSAVCKICASNARKLKYLIY